MKLRARVGGDRQAFLARLLMAELLARPHCGERGPLARPCVGRLRSRVGAVGRRAQLRGAGEVPGAGSRRD